MYVFMYVFMCMYVCVWVYVYECVCMYMYVCERVCMCMYVYACMYVIFFHFFLCSIRSKKVTIPPSSISRVIGRNGVNINTIRDVTGAHIDVERQNNKGGERNINIK